MRRNKENLEINSLDKAENNFDELMNEISSFDEQIQKRLKMIKNTGLTLQSSTIFLVHLLQITL
jgi:hypothetical protein